MNTTISTSMPRRRIVLCLLLAACIAAASAPAHAAETRAPEVRVKEAFDQLKFDRPVFITHPGDGTNRLFVVEQKGLVHWFENKSSVRQGDIKKALDLRRKVSRQGEEEGLLGLAFHPKLAQTRQVFVHYSAPGPRRGVVARLLMDQTLSTIDPASEQTILEVPQPWNNHNGGMIAFGPDGCLYIGLGDGGAAGDPLNSGQDVSTLLGSILRIDVNKAEGDKPYAVPPDNPLVKIADARPEIWAWGLRNPWRFSFDRRTGDLWAGDVGQDRREEIDLIVRGGNYGWNIREGTIPFKPRDTDQTLIEPVIDHPRQDASSITGGYIYRGKAIPDLVGWYVYGDYGSGFLWLLKYDAKQQRVLAHHRLASRVGQITSFGEDRDGEIYICSADGRIHRLEPGR